MRFSIAVLVAATSAMLLTGGVTVASTLDRPAIPRPVGFSAVDTEPMGPVTHR